MKPDINIKFPAAFTYSRFRFRLKLMEKTELPVFKGSLLRGVMGQALHRLNCTSRGSCERCKMVKTCAYSILFKPELVLKRQLTTPPFVLYSPNRTKEFDKGEKFEFSLTIFGEYSRYFDYFLNAFNYARGIGLGKRRVPFDIEEIVDDVSGEWVYRDREVNRNWQVAHADFSTLKPLPRKNIKIEFLTPVFLKRNKRPVYFPVMAEVLSAIIRRVHILSRTIWRDREFMIDKGFIKNLETGIDEYELKYEKSFKTGGLGNIVELSGFYGKVEYVGDFTAIYPLLRAGEVLHIGSKTSYGLGKYMLLDL